MNSMCARRWAWRRRVVGAIKTNAQDAETGASRQGGKRLPHILAATLGPGALSLGALGLGALLALGPAPALAQGGVLVHETATGHQLQLPPLDAYRECADADRVLNDISDTGYRVGPRPTSDDDLVLYEYEKRLSELALNTLCQRQSFYGSTSQ